MFLLAFISISMSSLLFILLLKAHKSNLPPSPPSLPFIGNLHQVGLVSQQSLNALSRKHGPLMLLHLGLVPTIIVSSPEVAEEVMRKQDDVFASRPSTKAWNLLLYGSRNVGFAPYGKYWKQAKRLYITHLLGPMKVKSFDQMREVEVLAAVEKIQHAHKCSNPIDLSEVFSSYTLDIICRIVSKNFSKKHLLRELIEEGTPLFSEFNFEDYFPILQCLDIFTGFNSKVNKMFNQWDELLDEVIQQHINGPVDGEKDEHLVDMLLTLQANNSGGFELTKDHVKAILIELFAGGSHTTFITIEWAMAELVHNQKAMKKLQQEIRQIGHVQHILTNKDIKEMPYLTSVIKETLRLHPPAPLLVPRESMHDTNVKGYDIPKGTKVLINAWSINRDPNYWENPDEFSPERFMGNNNMDFWGNNFEFIPFGAGKRLCPGINFAQSNIELILANILYHFDWELPRGEVSLDMSEAAGLSARRAQNLRLIPR
ncbi:Cytochrome P450 [Rhynchospora pubera]|uniref:Cytochrome P450 n=1 Tax=Rhynchospora pubera TaxID=906938 RepID=A0AAV8DZH1_9POAL|nr:Cytochrome P450 [Rhynchospora pubera]